MKKIKIGYFADGPWSHRALKKLLSDESLQICFICARYINPDDYLREISAELNIDFLTHQNVNSDEFIEHVESFNCDLFVSMSFNQIFRARLLNLPRLKTINCHAGKLPFYRGCSVLNWVLINDEIEFGITVHYIDEGIDTGDIILQHSFPINDDDTYGTILERAYDNCGEVLFEGIKLIQSGGFEPLRQSDIHSTGFYCTARGEGDEILDWNQSSREVFNFVRALYEPGPIARSIVRGSEIMIRKAELLPDAPIYKGIPGAILEIGSNYFIVKTKDSFIKIVDWAGEVKPRMGDRLK
jgi:methionyl-tRNA formyltransferase